MTLTDQYYFMACPQTTFNAIGFVTELFGQVTMNSTFCFAALLAHQLHFVTHAAFLAVKLPALMLAGFSPRTSTRGTTSCHGESRFLMFDEHVLFSEISTAD